MERDGRFFSMLKVLGRIIIVVLVSAIGAILGAILSIYISKVVYPSLYYIDDPLFFIIMSLTVSSYLGFLTGVISYPLLNRRIKSQGIRYLSSFLLSLVGVIILLGILLGILVIWLPSFF